MSSLFRVSNKWNFRTHCAAGTILPYAMAEGPDFVAVGTTEGSVFAYQLGVAEPSQLARFETVSVLLSLGSNNVCVVCVEGTVAVVEVLSAGLVLVSKSAGPTNCLCGATQNNLVMLGSLDRRVDILQQVENENGRCFVRRQQVSVPGQVYSVDQFFFQGQLLSVVGMARKWQVVTFSEMDCSTLLSQRVLRSDEVQEDVDDSMTKSLALGVSVIEHSFSSATVGLMTEDGFVLLHSLNRVSPEDPQLSAVMTHRIHVSAAVPRMGRLGASFCAVTHDGTIIVVDPTDGKVSSVEALDHCVSLAVTGGGIVAASLTEIFRLRLSVANRTTLLSS